eukprot:tig00000849_g4776.t1
MSSAPLEWTQDEKRALLAAHKAHGKNWRRISEDPSFAPSLLRIRADLDQRAFIDELGRQWRAIEREREEQKKQKNKSAGKKRQATHGASGPASTAGVATAPGSVTSAQCPPNSEIPAPASAEAAAAPVATAPAAPAAPNDVDVIEIDSDEEGPSTLPPTKPPHAAPAPPRTPAPNLAQHPSTATPAGTAGETGSGAGSSPASSTAAEVVDLASESEGEGRPSPPKRPRLDEAAAPAGRELVPVQGAGDEDLGALDGLFDALDSDPPPPAAPPAPPAPPPSDGVRIGRRVKAERAAAIEQQPAPRLGPEARKEVTIACVGAVQEMGSLSLRHRPNDTWFAVDLNGNFYGRVSSAEAWLVAPFVAAVKEAPSMIRMRAAHAKNKSLVSPWRGERAVVSVSIQLHDDLPGRLAGLRALHADLLAEAAAPEAAEAERRREVARAALHAAAEDVHEGFGRWHDFDAGVMVDIAAFARRVAPQPGPAVIEYGLEDAVDGYRALGIELARDAQKHLVGVLGGRRESDGLFPAIHVPTEIALCGGRLAVRALPCPPGGPWSAELAYALLRRGADGPDAYPWSDGRLCRKIQKQMEAGKPLHSEKLRSFWGPAVALVGATPSDRRKKVDELVKGLPEGRVVLEVGSRSTLPRFEFLAVLPSANVVRSRLLQPAPAAPAPGPPPSGLTPPRKDKRTAASSARQAELDGLQVVRWILAAGGRVHARAAPLSSLNLFSVNDERAAEEALVRETGKGLKGHWWLL